MDGFQEPPSEYGHFTSYFGGIKTVSGLTVSQFGRIQAGRNCDTVRPDTVLIPFLTVFLQQLTTLERGDRPVAW